MLACDAANDVGSGAQGAVNTLTAVRRVAASDHENLHDFLQALAANDLQMVVDSRLARQIGGIKRTTVKAHFDVTDEEVAVLGLVLVGGTSGTAGAGVVAAAVASSRCTWIRARSAARPPSRTSSACSG